MTPLALSATTVVSALGIGAAAHGEAIAARHGGLRRNDFEPLVGGWIGRVAEVESAVLPPALSRFDCRNNRLAALALGADGFAAAVARARRRYGPARIGLVLGTSTSGIGAAEEAYATRNETTGALPAGFNFASTQNLGSLADFVASALGLEGPALVVSTACASSARTFLDATQLIEAGLCDAAVVGGADSLCRMTLQGFNALELISPDACCPCDATRAGISIGEAAGFALLEQPQAAPDATFMLLGAGASNDGYHMSAPHPQGVGAAAAMRCALESAGISPEQVDWVHLHGTGTNANDAAEDLAVQSVFGRTTPCSSTKAYTGHTLGACGILEAVIEAECTRRSLLPGCLNLRHPDPAFGACIVMENLHRPLRHVVNNAFGFGGVNCSLVFGVPA